MNRKRSSKNQQPLAKIISAFVILSLLSTDLGGFLLLIGAVGFIFYLAFRFAKKSGGTSKQQKNTFDDCPKPFCFHKDKGEHHVRRGKEIDPWDRPDIDISKYQRRR